MDDQHEKENLVFEAQAGFCKAMANPVRIQIAYLLRGGPLAVNEIVSQSGLPVNTISRHLSALRAAGIVEYQRNGKELHYQLTDPQIGEICGQVRAFLCRQMKKRSTLLNHS